MGGGGAKRLEREKEEVGGRAKRLGREKEEVGGGRESARIVGKICFKNTTAVGCPLPLSP